MRRDFLLPAVVGYETELSPDAISDWLKGERKSAEFVALADNARRAALGLQFLSNIGVLINEIESAPEGKARRGELRDVLIAEIAAARRVMEMMRAEGGQSPERLAETIRGALAPGDTMLIKRGGASKERGTETA